MWSSKWAMPSSPLKTIFKSGVIIMSITYFTLWKSARISAVGNAEGVSRDSNKRWIIVSIIKMIAILIWSKRDKSNRYIHQKYEPKGILKHVKPFNTKCFRWYIFSQLWTEYFVNEFYQLQFSFYFINSTQTHAPKHKLLKLTGYSRLVSICLLSVMFVHACMHIHVIWISLAVLNASCWCWQFVIVTM